MNKPNTLWGQKYVDIWTSHSKPIDINLFWEAFPLDFDKYGCRDFLPFSHKSISRRPVFRGNKAQLAIIVQLQSQTGATKLNQRKTGQKSVAQCGSHSHHLNGFIRFSPAKLTAPSQGGRPLDSNSLCRSTEGENVVHEFTNDSGFGDKFSDLWINLSSYPCYLSWTGLARYHRDFVAFVSEQASQLTAHKARSSSYKEEQYEEM